jgi:hypothetical protein
MMTSFWHFIADCFQHLFNLMERLSMFPNRVFLVIGFIGAIGWVVYQYKHNHEEKGRV